MAKTHIFHHEYSWKNDGQPRVLSALERGINEAMLAMHEAGVWEWDHIIVTNLNCNDPSHYPDICYHYSISIQGVPDNADWEHLYDDKQEALD